MYDLSGRRIALLFRGATDGSPASRDWNGRDEAGRKVAAGIYFVRLEAEGILETRKVVLLR